MGAKKNLEAMIFGKWTVLHQVGKNNYGMAKWLCRCYCGKEKSVLQGSLVARTSVSCGCGDNRRKTVHGYLSNGEYPKEYSSWRNMINRCYNKKHNSYKTYGAIGIIVCDRWRHSFSNFMSDMGKMPSTKHSIDRYPDKDGIYEHSNCRWATGEEQGENRKDAILITHNGKTKTIRGWDRILGSRVVRWRINNGWDEQTAVSIPVNKYNHG
jgi:hypothetical protein